MTWSIASGHFRCVYDELELERLWRLLRGDRERRRGGGDRLRGGLQQTVTILNRRIKPGIVQ